MEQGSQEWLQARCGKVTGSRFADVLQKRGLSKTGLNYMLEIVGEILTGVPADTYTSKEMAWGSKHEEFAKTWYILERGVTIEESPFVLHPDNPFVGCSPDSLVGTEGILEIKCPYNTRVHINTILEDKVPEEYEPQVHGNMWVTGRKWCDFVSYDPRIKDDRLRQHVIRVDRDEQYAEYIEESVFRFVEQIKIRLKKLGVST